MTKIEEMPILARAAEIKPLQLATTKKTEVPNYIAAMGVLFKEMAQANGKHAEQKSREASTADLATRAQHTKQSKRHNDSGFDSFYSRSGGAGVQLLTLALASGLQHKGIIGETGFKNITTGASYAASGSESFGSWYAKGHEGNIDGKGRSDMGHAQSVEQTARAGLRQTVDSAYSLSQLATQAFAAAAAAYRS